MTASPSDIPPWELGSEFHWDCLSGSARPQHPWSNCDHRTGASGRDVLRLLIHDGIRQRGWQRCWLPSYLCQEVIQSVVATGINCELYPDLPVVGSIPNLDGIQGQTGDVVFVVNQFGVRQRPLYEELSRAGVHIVEDHTHDPWSDWATSSSATYCMASLRKTLPIPDGGVLWSPGGSALPEPAPLSSERELASARKCAAMVLKQRYLRGDASNKDTFRTLFSRGETHIADGAISSATELSCELIGSLDVAAWRQKRNTNFHTLVESLVGLEGVSPTDVTALPTGQVAFSVILTATSAALRDQLRHDLIANRIYPAVLWPMESPVLPISQTDLDFSRRSLSLHIDGRYQKADLLRVAELIRQTCMSLEGGSR